MEADIVVGDITGRDVDAVVNSTDSELAITGDVGIAFYHAIGHRFLDSAVEAAPVGVGQVAVTDAPGIPADQIIHAAVMLHDADCDPTAESIRRATRSILERAQQEGHRSVAVPALGCGVGGFDLEEGTSIILEEVRDHEPGPLDRVELVIYDEDDADSVREL